MKNHPVITLAQRLTESHIVHPDVTLWASFSLVALDFLKARRQAGNFELQTAPVEDLARSLVELMNECDSPFTFVQVGLTAAFLRGRGADATVLQSAIRNAHAERSGMVAEDTLLRDQVKRLKRQNEVLAEYRAACAAYCNAPGAECETLEQGVELERKAEARLEAATDACNRLARGDVPDIVREVELLRAYRAATYAVEDCQDGPARVRALAQLHDAETACLEFYRDGSN